MTAGPANKMDFIGEGGCDRAKENKLEEIKGAQKNEEAVIKMKLPG